jgi:hypothetical protein
LSTDEFGNIIYEERQVPANDLGGIVYRETPDGIVVERRVPTCSSCGKSLVNELVRCASCRTTLCHSCAIPYEVKYYCTPCIMRWFNLPKPEFMTLFCIRFGVCDPTSIAQITGLPETNIRWILQECFSWQCITQGLQLTERGRILVAIYSHVYSRAPDMVAFAERVRDWRASQAPQEAM